MPPQGQAEPVGDDLDIITPPWYATDHHDPAGGFRNVWPPRAEGSVWKGLKWFLSQGFRKKENRLPDVRNIESLRSPSTRPRFTWIGHATVLIQAGALDLLVDPMFGDRASPFAFAGPARAPALPLPIDGLPNVDVVILSHDHYDHLDKQSIERLIGRHDPVFLAPLGVAAYVRDWGSERVLEMDWWQYVDLAGTRYHCVPAKHSSGRGLLDRDATLWSGWYLEHLPGGLDVFCAGDTAYAEHFRLIGERIGRPDVAVLPIGAYLPAWLMQPVHVNPEEALDAFRDLEARHFIPVHWGTFDLAEEPLHAPADALRRLVRERGLERAVHLLDIGETWTPAD